MRGPIAIALVCTFLAACRSTPLPYEDSPFSVIPAGSRLVLQRALTIPAGRASLYIQGGEVRPYAEVDPYRPHCRLEVEKVLETPQRIEPDDFLVEKVIYEEIPRLASATADVSPVRLAAAGGLAGSGNGSEAPAAAGRGTRLATGTFSLADGTSYWTYATHFRLRSERQPEVRLLTCQHWEDPALAVHLTIRQIRETLGGIFTLELRASGGGGPNG